MTGRGDYIFFSIFLIVLFSAGYRTRNYPIRSAKFLDALGHPHVRKWEFDTLAAAATFQCLVLCHGITRPIRNIDVLALLDMLVPDQRDVWKAWKERVADRIVHETNISYAPSIPTFGDERQQQLKALLDQAQLGDYAYRRFYVWSRVRVPRIPSRQRPVVDPPPLADFHCFLSLRCSPILSFFLLLSLYRSPSLCSIAHGIVLYTHQVLGY